MNFPAPRTMSQYIYVLCSFPVLGVLLYQQEAEYRGAGLSQYVAQSEFLLIFHPDPEGQLLVPQRNHILGLVPSYDLGCSLPQALAVLGKRGVTWSTPDSKEQVQASVQPQFSGKILGSGSSNRLGLALCANTPVKETCWE